MLPEFVVLINGEPVIYIIGGIAFLLCMNIASSLLHGDKPANLDDIMFSVKDHDFRDKK